MRGVFEVFDATGERLDVAADLLLEGKPFTFADVRFRREPAGDLVCEAVTQWVRADPTEAEALDAIVRARAVFEDLCGRSSKLASLAKSVPVRYVVIRDLDIGTLEVCREQEGRLVWARNGAGAG